MFCILRQVRQKHRDLAFLAKKLKTKSPPSSPTKVPKSPVGLELPPLPAHVYHGREAITLECQPTDLPPFLYNKIPKVGS